MYFCFYQGFFYDLLKNCLSATTERMHVDRDKSPHVYIVVFPGSVWKKTVTEFLLTKYGIGVITSNPPDRSPLVFLYTYIYIYRQWRRILFTGFDKTASCWQEHF